MNICIKTIPHKEQRYETVGDYFYEGKTLCIRVSEMSDWRYEMLVVVHELVELFIVKHQKIPFKKIDTFDILFEKTRRKGSAAEPGDSPYAPYRFAHCVATGVERMLAAVMGVIWQDYDHEINSL